MDPEAAAAAGAMALFGEKYGDEVRVLMMGARDGPAADPSRPSCAAAPTCAGPATSGLFKIVSEGAVGAGVRRIEAVTGFGRGGATSPARRRPCARCRRCFAQGRTSCRGGSPRFSRSGESSNASLREARRALATGGGGGDGAVSREIGGVRYSPRLLDGVPARDLKGLADDLKKQLGSGVVALDLDGRGQGLAGGRGHRRSEGPDQRHRSGPRRLGGGGRQGRWRTTRHGPGRRPRRSARASRAGCHRAGDHRGCRKPV